MGLTAWKFKNVDRPEGRVSICGYCERVVYNYTTKTDGQGRPVPPGQSSMPFERHMDDECPGTVTPIEATP